MSDFDEIRNTIARNNHALDDRRYDDCVRTYAPDGVIAGRRGHAAIREFMNHQELATRPDLERRHVNTNIAITVAGDVAEAVSD
ncbi:nuclear transport factor 2 family protein, partial [Kibdelosporangium lantanae]